MTIVTSYDWTSDTWTHNGENPTRQMWRNVVAEISEKAKAALPECVTRIEKAVAIVLSGDIELLPDGTAKVGSQSQGQTVYHICNGSCECPDVKRAPQGFCKHRLSVAIYKRAHALTKERLEQLDAASNGTTTPAPEHVETEALVPVPTQEPVAAPVTPALPEAPASANVYIEIAGRKVQITLRDTSEEQLLSRMEKLLSRFPAEEPESTTPLEGWCSKHEVQMKLNHNKKGSWWSHKTNDGQWCNKK